MEVKEKSTTTASLSSPHTPGSHPPDFSDSVWVALWGGLLGQKVGSGWGCSGQAFGSSCKALFGKRLFSSSVDPKTETMALTPPLHLLLSLALF